MTDLATDYHEAPRVAVLVAAPGVGRVLAILRAGLGGALHTQYVVARVGPLRQRERGGVRALREPAAGEDCVYRWIVPDTAGPAT